MKSADQALTALLLIDIQRGFDQPSSWGGARNNSDFEQNITSLLSAFRSYSTTHPSHAPHIIHIHHHSLSPTSALHPSSTFTPPNSSTPIRGIDPQPYAFPLPNEPVFTKSVNSSFIGTKLEEYIRTHGIRQLVVVGLTTDHCVSTTVRMAANLKVLWPQGDVSEESVDGKGVVVVRDATATFGRGEWMAEVVHEVQLASLEGEFCEVGATGKVLRQVLGMGEGE